MDFTVIITSAVSCTVNFVLGGALALLAAKRRGMMKREKAIREGLQCLLRNQLIEYHEKYTERNVCPIYVKEAARRGYDAYHALGGNGVVTKLFEDLMALPEEPHASGRDPSDEAEHVRAAAPREEPAQGGGA